MGLLIALVMGQATPIALPVLDRSKSIRVRPVNANVVMCTSPAALPLQRLAQRSVDRGGPDYGIDASKNGCTLTLNTDPMNADYQEDVVWTGALRPPAMIKGTLRVVRVRFPTPLDGVPMDSYYFVAADDLKPA